MNFRNISSMSIGQLLDDADFREHYAALYNTCNSSSDGHVHFETQCNYLKKLIMDSPKLQQATTLSYATALLDLAYYGLSIEPVAKALAYIVPRGHNKGSRSQPVWETRALLLISAYGELQLRMRSGVIRYADNPVLVHEGDDFTIVNGRVHHTAKFLSDVITHAYIKITRHDGSTEYKHFSMADILSYREMSDQKNSKAWTGGKGGQPSRGMIEAKVIKHAFSTYPKGFDLKASTALATDMDVTDPYDAEIAYANTMAALSEQMPDEDDSPVTQPAEQPTPTPVQQTQTNDIPEFEF